MHPTDQTSTTFTPSLTGLRVLFARQQQFGRPVPPRGNIVSHKRHMCSQLGNIGAGQTEVADLKVAVGIHQDVARLLRQGEKYQIAVQDVCRVDVLQAAEDLVEEELAVLVGEVLRRLDDVGQVGFH